MSNSIDSFYTFCAGVMGDKPDCSGLSLEEKTKYIGGVMSKMQKKASTLKGAKQKKVVATKIGGLMGAHMGDTFVGGCCPGMNVCNTVGGSVKQIDQSIHETLIDVTKKLNEMEVINNASIKFLELEKSSVNAKDRKKYEGVSKMISDYAKEFSALKSELNKISEEFVRETAADGQRFMPVATEAELPSKHANELAIKYLKGIFPVSFTSMKMKEIVSKLNVSKADLMKAMKENTTQEFLNDLIVELAENDSMSFDKKSEAMDAIREFQDVVNKNPDFNSIAVKQLSTFVGGKDFTKKEYFDNSKYLKTRQDLEKMVDMGSVNTETKRQRKAKEDIEKRIVSLVKVADKVSRKPSKKLLEGEEKLRGEFVEKLDDISSLGQLSEMNAFFGKIDAVNGPRMRAEVYRRIDDISSTASSIKSYPLMPEFVKELKRFRELLMKEEARILKNTSKVNMDYADKPSETYLVGGDADFKQIANMFRYNESRNRTRNAIKDIGSELKNYEKNQEEMIRAVHGKLIEEDKKEFAKYKESLIEMTEERARLLKSLLKDLEKSGYDSIVEKRQKEAIEKLDGYMTFLHTNLENKLSKGDFKEVEKKVSELVEGFKIESENSKELKGELKKLSEFTNTLSMDVGENAKSLLLVSVLNNCFMKCMSVKNAYDEYRNQGDEYVVDVVNYPYMDDQKIAVRELREMLNKNVGICMDLIDKLNNSAGLDGKGAGLASVVMKGLKFTEEKKEDKVAEIVEEEEVENNDDAEEADENNDDAEEADEKIDAPESSKSDDRIKAEAYVRGWLKRNHSYAGKNKTSNIKSVDKKVSFDSDVFLKIKKRFRYSYEELAYAVEADRKGYCRRSAPYWENVDPILKAYFKNYIDMKLNLLLMHVKGDNIIQDVVGAFRNHIESQSRDMLLVYCEKSMSAHYVIPTDDKKLFRLKYFPIGRDKDSNLVFNYKDKDNYPPIEGNDRMFVDAYVGGAISETSIDDALKKAKENKGLNRLRFAVIDDNAYACEQLDRAAEGLCEYLQEMNKYAPEYIANVAKVMDIVKSIEVDASWFNAKLPNYKKLMEYFNSRIMKIKKGGANVTISDPDSDKGSLQSVGGVILTDSELMLVYKEVKRLIRNMVTDKKNPEMDSLRNVFHVFTGMYKNITAGQAKKINMKIGQLFNAINEYLIGTTLIVDGSDVRLRKFGENMNLGTYKGIHDYNLLMRYGDGGMKHYDPKKFPEKSSASSLTGFNDYITSEDEYLRIFARHDLTLERIFKAIAVKTIGAFEIYKYWHLGDKEGGEYNKNTSLVRTVFGASEPVMAWSSNYLGRVPKIMPEYIEAYVRMGVLSSFYRDLFTTSLHDGAIESFSERFAVIPSGDSLFNNLFSVIFVKNFNADVAKNNAKMKLDRDFVGEINKLVQIMPGATPTAKTRSLINKFIDEVNARYGVVQTNDIIDYLTKTKEEKYTKFKYFDEKGNPVSELSDLMNEQNNGTKISRRLGLDGEEETLDKNLVPTDDRVKSQKLLSLESDVQDYESAKNLHERVQILIHGFRSKLDDMTNEMDKITELDATEIQGAGLTGEIEDIQKELQLNRDNRDRFAILNKEFNNLMNNKDMGKGTILDEVDIAKKELLDAPIKLVSNVYKLIIDHITAFTGGRIPALTKGTRIFDLKSSSTNLVDFVSFDGRPQLDFTSLTNLTRGILEKTASNFNKIRKRLEKESQEEYVKKIEFATKLHEAMVRQLSEIDYTNVKLNPTMETETIQHTQWVNGEVDGEARKLRDGMKQINKNYIEALTKVVYKETDFPRRLDKEGHGYLVGIGALKNNGKVKDRKKFTTFGTKYKTFKSSLKEVTDRVSVFEKIWYKNVSPKRENDVAMPKSDGGNFDDEEIPFYDFVDLASEYKDILYILLKLTKEEEDDEEELGEEGIDEWIEEEEGEGEGEEEEIDDFVGGSTEGHQNKYRLNEMIIDFGNEIHSDPLQISNPEFQKFHRSDKRIMGLQRPDQMKKIELHHDGKLRYNVNGEEDPLGEYHRTYVSTNASEKSKTNIAPQINFYLHSNNVRPHNIYQLMDFLLISIYEEFYATVNGKTFQPLFDKIYSLLQSKSRGDVEPYWELGGHHIYEKGLCFSKKTKGLYEWLVNNDKTKMTMDIGEVPQYLIDKIRKLTPLFIMLATHCGNAAAIHREYSDNVFEGDSLLSGPEPIAVVRGGGSEQEKISTEMKTTHNAHSMFEVLAKFLKGRTNEEIMNLKCKETYSNIVDRRFLYNLIYMLGPMKDGKFDAEHNYGTLKPGKESLKELHDILIGKSEFNPENNTDFERTALSESYESGNSLEQLANKYGKLLNRYKTFDDDELIKEMDKQKIPLYQREHICSIPRKKLVHMKSLIGDLSGNTDVYTVIHNVTNKPHKMDVDSEGLKKISQGSTELVGGYEGSDNVFADNKYNLKTSFSDNVLPKNANVKYQAVDDSVEYEGVSREYHGYKVYKPKVKEQYEGTPPEDLNKSEINEKSQCMMDVADSLIKILRELYYSVYDKNSDTKYGRQESQSRFSVLFERSAQTVPVSIAVDALPVWDNELTRDGTTSGLRCKNLKEIRSLLNGEKSSLFDICSVFLRDDTSHPITLDDLPSLKKLSESKKIGINLDDFAKDQGKLLKYLYEIYFKSMFSSQVGPTNMLSSPVGPDAYTHADEEYYKMFNDFSSFGGFAEKHPGLGGDEAVMEYINDGHENEHKNEIISSGSDVRNMFRSNLKSDKMSSYYGIDRAKKKSLGGNSDLYVYARNAMDIGRFPINIHSMMREFPLSELYHDEFTYGVMKMTPDPSNPDNETDIPTNIDGLYNGSKKIKGVIITDIVPTKVLGAAEGLFGVMVLSSAATSKKETKSKNSGNIVDFDNTFALSSVIV